MVLPRLDVVLGLPARTIKPQVKFLGAATFKIGHDEAGVGSLGPGLDAGDDALGPAPAPGGIVELRKAPHLAARRGGPKALGGGFLQRLSSPE